LARKLLGTHPLARLRKEWEDNIKTDIGGTGCEDGRGMKIPHDQVQWTYSVLAVLKLWILLPFSY
jgi:hypothetical protein